MAAVLQLTGFVLSIHIKLSQEGWKFGLAAFVNYAK